MSRLVLHRVSHGPKIPVLSVLPRHKLKSNHSDGNYIRTGQVQMCPKMSSSSAHFSPKYISPRSLGQGSVCPDLAANTLRLYSMRFCPYALRTRLVLAYKNIHHETVNINLMNKPDWFLARHPKGLVPVLEYNKNIVYESTVCNDLLDEVYPQNKLYPDDPYKKARLQMLMEIYRPIAIGFYQITFAPSDDKKEKAIRRVRRAIEELEKELQGPYFGGNVPCMLDFNAYPHLAIWQFIWEHSEEITKESQELGQIPQMLSAKLYSWLQTMKKLPAVIQNTESPESMIKFVRSWRERKNIDYDAGLNVAKL